MKKYKILKNFKDKYNNTRYETNKIYEFTDERANEILKVGKLIELVEEIVEETEEIEEVKEVKPRKRGRK